MAIPSDVVKQILIDPVKAAESTRRSGQPLVGIIGPAVPRELVAAAGCFPVRLSPRIEDWARRSDWLEDQHEAAFKSLFIQAIDGRFDPCELILIDSTSDSRRFLYQYLREMRRRGHAAHLPAVVHYDFLCSEGSWSRHHCETSFRDLGRRLTSLAGATLSESDLRMHVDLANRARHAAAALQSARVHGAVSSVTAARTLRAAQSLDFETALTVLGHTLGSTEETAADTARPRILLISSANLYFEHVHALVERQGGTVVNEIDDEGFRYFPPDADVNSPTGDSLVDWYRRQIYCARMPRTRRDEFLRTAIDDANVHGVLFHLPSEDQMLGWHYPGCRTYADRLGKPSILVRSDLQVRHVNAPWMAAVDTLLQQIRSSRGGRGRAPAGA